MARYVRDGQIFEADEASEADLKRQGFSPATQADIDRHNKQAEYNSKDFRGKLVETEQAAIEGLMQGGRELGKLRVGDKLASSMGLSDPRIDQAAQAHRDKTDRLLADPGVAERAERHPIAHAIGVDAPALFISGGVVGKGASLLARGGAMALESVGVGALEEAVGSTTEGRDFDAGNAANIAVQDLAFSGLAAAATKVASRVGNLLLFGAGNTTAKNVKRGLDETAGPVVPDDVRFDAPLLEAETRSRRTAAASSPDMPPGPERDEMLRRAAPDLNEKVTREGGEVVDSALGTARKTASVDEDAIGRRIDEMLPETTPAQTAWSARATERLDKARNSLSLAADEPAAAPFVARAMQLADDAIRAIDGSPDAATWFRASAKASEQLDSLADDLSSASLPAGSVVEKTIGDLRKWVVKSLSDRTLFGQAAEMHASLRGPIADKIDAATRMAGGSLRKRLADFVAAPAAQRGKLRVPLEQAAEGLEELAQAHERFGTALPKQIEDLKERASKLRRGMALADDVQAAIKNKPVDAEFLPDEAAESVRKSVVDAVDAEAKRSGKNVAAETIAEIIATRMSSTMATAGAGIGGSIAGGVGAMAGGAIGRALGKRYGKAAAETILKMAAKFARKHGHETTAAALLGAAAIEDESDGNGAALATVGGLGLLFPKFSLHKSQMFQSIVDDLSQFEKATPAVLKDLKNMTFVMVKNGKLPSHEADEIIEAVQKAVDDPELLQKEAKRIYGEEISSISSAPVAGKVSESTKALALERKLLGKNSTLPETGAERAEAVKRLVDKVDKLPEVPVIEAVDDDVINDLTGIIDRAVATLPEDELKAIRKFTGGYSDLYRQAERSPESVDAPTREVVPKLNEAIDKILIVNPTKHGQLHRGIAVPDDALDELMNVDELYTHSATSTSYDMAIAESFAFPGGDSGKHSVFFHFTSVDYGAPVLNTRAASLGKEAEVVIPRGGKYKVTGRFQDFTGGKLRLHMMLEQVANSSKDDVMRMGALAVLAAIGSQSDEDGVGAMAAAGVLGALVGKGKLMGAGRKLVTKISPEVKDMFARAEAEITSESSADGRAIWNWLTDNSEGMSAGKTEAFARAYDNLATKNPTQHGPLYRGMALKSSELQKIIQSGEFANNNFASASYSAPLARKYADVTGAEKKVLLAIEDSERGLIAPNKMDAEVILPKGERYEVVDHYEQKVPTDDGSGALVDTSEPTTVLVLRAKRTAPDAVDPRQLGTIPPKGKAKRPDGPIAAKPERDATPTKFYPNSNQARNEYGENMRPYREAQRADNTRMAQLAKDYGLGAAALAAGGGALAVAGDANAAEPEDRMVAAERILAIDQAATQRIRHTARVLAGLAEPPNPEGLTTHLARFGAEHEDPRAAFEERKAILTKSEISPALVYDVLGSSLGDVASVSPELYQAAAARILDNFRYLRENLPPEVKTSLMHPKGMPVSESAMRDFATQWNTVMDPESVNDDIELGTVTHLQIETLRNAHQDIYQQLRTEIIEEVGANFESIPTSTKMQLDILFQADGLAGPMFSSEAAAIIGAAGKAASQRKQAGPPQIGADDQDAAASSNGLEAIRSSVTNRGA